MLRWRAIESSDASGGSVKCNDERGTMKDELKSRRRVNSDVGRY